MLFIFILPTGRWEVYETEFTHMGKNSRNPELVSKNITIHHECPCRIDISPECWKFNLGRGLQSPWFNSDPKSEISLSYMDRLIMDCFAPTIRRFLSEHKILKN